MSWEISGTVCQSQCGDMYCTALGGCSVVQAQAEGSDSQALPAEAAERRLQRVPNSALRSMALRPLSCLDCGREGPPSSCTTRPGDRTAHHCTAQVHEPPGGRAATRAAPSSRRSRVVGAPGTPIAMSLRFPPEAAERSEASRDLRSIAMEGFAEPQGRSSSQVPSASPGLAMISPNTSGVFLTLLR
jgi:hypothetical protein